MAHATRLIAALFLLSACGQTPAGQGPRPTNATEAMGQEHAGPSLLLEGPRRLVLVPASGPGARQLWGGPGQVALATEGGRVVVTAGFAQMVTATTLHEPDPLQDPRALLGQDARVRRMVDLAGADRDPGSMRFGLIVECVMRGRAEGGWILIEERCAGDVPAFTNRFWADPATGIVWRSEQWAGDGIPMLRVQRRGP